MYLEDQSQADRFYKSSTRSSLKNQQGGVSFIAWYLHPQVLSGEYTNPPLHDMNCFRTTKGIINFIRSRKSCAKHSMKPMRQLDGRYLATILDLHMKDLHWLRELRRDIKQHMQDKFGYETQNDSLQMYFHFPYEESRTTLHLHIRLNQEMLPVAKLKAIQLEDEVDEHKSKLVEGYFIQNINMSSHPSSWPKAGVSDAEMQHQLQNLGDDAVPHQIRVHQQASASQLARDDLRQRLHKQLEINKPGYIEAKDVSVCTKIQWRPLCYTFEAETTVIDELFQSKIADLKGAKALQKHHPSKEELATSDSRFDRSETGDTLYLFYAMKSCTINGRTSVALMYMECDFRIWPAEASADPKGVTPASLERYAAGLRYRAAENCLAVLS
ncbi:unnamed protein product [Symbiodinium sp. CCMP2592]|nr:unnamed protein product [Symbiodinium sp. CCMP2592]